MPPILFTFLHLGAVSKVEEMLSVLVRPVSITGNRRSLKPIRRSLRPEHSRIRERGNLGQLPATGAIVIALPMKIQGGSGGPLRIVAVAP